MSGESLQSPGLGQATVDLSVYVAPVPRSALAEKLRQRLRNSRSAFARRVADSLGLDTPAGFDDAHPVVVESWQIRAGGILIGGVDQEIWARYAGSAWGAMAAAALPPFWRTAWSAAESGADPMAGGAAGPQRSALEAGSTALLRSAITGAMAGARGATAATALAKQRFGSYREVIVLVPCVRLAMLQAPASFVAGMHTDSTFARMIDRLFGYGFAKEAARITHDARGLHVESATGRSQLRTSEEQLSTNVVAAPDYWQQPLLGMSAAGSLALSHLTRTPSVAGLGISARLHVEADVRWLMPESDYRIEPAAMSGAHGGLSLRDVHFELSAPRHFH